MRVDALEMRGFTRHADTLLEFPKRGIVLVTGANGSGKSSVVEGVAYGGWGETLRGSIPGGRGGVRCEVVLHARAGNEKVRVQRWRKDDRPYLEWQRPEAPQGFPTASKAQEALEGLLGSFEVWHRTHVFSSADAAHFTMATDKERKLFLEALLGLGRFDEALEKARAQVKELGRRCETLESQEQAVAATLAGAEQRVRDAIASLEEAPPEVVGTPAQEKELEQSSARLKELIKRAEGELAELRREISGMSADTGGAEREALLLSRRLQRLGQDGTCDACGQVVPEEVREGMRRDVERIRAEAEAAKERARAAQADFKAETQDLEAALSRLRAKESALSAELAGIKRSAEARDATRRMRDKAIKAQAEGQEQARKSREDLKRIRQELPGVSRELVVATAVEKVLGIRGARAGITASLLKELQRATNSWLPRVAGAGLKLELSSYSERRSGGFVDSISLQVKGAGGGEGYRAASQGERRRIDVAILLALAGDGTLFFDEVFDALDAEGMTAVAEVLGELSRERCVLVITHSEEMASRLPHAVLWTVQDGRVHVG